LREKHREEKENPCAVFDAEKKGRGGGERKGGIGEANAR